MAWGLIRGERLGGEQFSPLGPDFYAFTAEDWNASTQPNALIQIALDAAGQLPDLEWDFYDAAITTAPDAPMPWVSVEPRRFAAHIGLIEARLRANPMANSTMARVLRLTETMEFAEALEVESMAYSMLLGGGEFRRWLSEQRHDADDVPTGPELVLYERLDDEVTLWLNSPDNRNAMTAQMRDALFEMLANVADDPSVPRLHLRGKGRCFSTGGHLAEFGSAQDGAAAHYIRSFRSAALMLHQIGPRSRAYLQGAVVGSGLEISAAAAERVAAADMFAQLPELSMGLIMGAGGCVTVPRAIGRHRCMWMALSAARVRADTALAWGLVHAIEAKI